MSFPIFNRRKPQPEKKGNTITLFGNQKGGVGKSTTCVMYADYLVQVKGIKLVVIDADPQHSVYKKWLQDQKDHPDNEPLYQVSTFDELDDEQATIDLVKDMRQQDYDFIIDTPGNIMMAGMMHLVHSVDVIMTPMQYEKTCAMSTNAYIDFVLDIADQSGKRTPMLFIPNMHNKRWGRGEELAYDKQTEADYNNVGIVLAKIPASPEIRRYSIFALSSKQLALVGPCFEKAWNFTYNELRKSA